MLKRIDSLIIILAGIILIAGLTLLAYLGFYNRYWSDDWCYNRDFEHLGVLQTVGTYFYSGEDSARGYSTNRYSLTLLSGLMYLPGLFGTQIQAALIIGFGIAGVLRLLSSLSKITPLPRNIRFLAAALLLYYCLYLSPQRFQTLYWQAGVHYSATIVAGVYMLGMILAQATGDKSKRAGYAGLALLSFFAGGFSETGSAFLITAFAIFLLFAWLGKRKGQEWAVRAFPAILTAVLGLVIALGTLTASPSNVRYEEMEVNPAPLFQVPVLALKYALFFVFDSLKTLPIPHFIFLAFFFGLSLLAASFSQKAAAGYRQAGRIILLTTGVVLILITAVQAPTAYFYSAPPDPRGQSVSRFTMLAGMAVISWVAGQAVSKEKKGWFNAVALVLIIVSAVYTARLIVQNYAELPGFIHRAEMWDARDQLIREARSRGVLKLEVPVIDTNEINTKDIMRSKDMGRWVGNCAAEYYGLEAIKAIGP